MPKITLYLLQALLISLFATSATAQQNGLGEQELRQLMQMAEYIGVDYTEAVKKGEIVNSGEYAEMQEFTQLLIDQARRLEPSPATDTVRGEAAALKAAIGRKAGLAEVREHTTSLRRALLAVSPELSLPPSLLDLDETQALYQSECAACHGSSGMGDGPLATQMEPPPTDFYERRRAENRSIVGLYDAISSGIGDTEMAAFPALTEQQRWSLAFFVGSLAFGDADATAVAGTALKLHDLVMHSPRVLRSDNPEIPAGSIAALRADPSALFAEKQAGGNEAMDITRTQLQLALAAYRQSDFSKARTLAVSAYLDGYEMVENTLDSRDPALRKSIERDLLALRSQLNSGSAPQQVELQVEAVLKRLDEAQALLEESGLSHAALFIASLIILLREGLEALLVVIALTTILIKTQRGDALKYVHLGWVSALAAGIATWLLAQKVITISGASREVMEGFAALVAAVVLFYVGFWMHSKTQAREWQKYIQKSISRSLTAGTLWGIAGLAFIAVYREVFETILFYQTLLAQTATGQSGPLWGGVAAGTALLAVAGWVLVRYSSVLPIGKFFSATTLILLALSFVLAGKAIAALQEAALVGISPMPLSFGFDWLGIHSTWQGFGVQAVILAAAIWLLWGRSGSGECSPVKVAD